MNIEEIKRAITELSPNDLAIFRKWFAKLDPKFRESNTLEPTTKDLLKKLRGSLKGKGLLKSLMNEKKRERDLQ
jgi:hypothetical protein